MTKPKDWSPFQYTTHTKLLLTFLEKKQSEKDSSTKNRNTWSLGSWAKRLGLSSAAPLSNILKGRTLPSLELAARMSETMGLDSSETEYLILLVELERQKNSIELIRNALRERIAELRTERFAKNA